MSDIILIDGNNWGFSGMGSPKLSAGDVDTNAPFYFIKRLRNLVMDHPNSLIMVLWDGRSWRHSVYSEYKAKRVKTEKQADDRSSYFDQKKIIIDFVRTLGITQVVADNMEADDLAQIITVNSLKQGKTVTLVTADKDWIQLVQPGVVWVDVIHDKYCNSINFSEQTGCKDATQFIDWKCVIGETGDSSDNIPGIKGIGPKTLENIHKIWPIFPGFIISAAKKQAEEKWLAVVGGKKLPKVLAELDLKEAMALYIRNQMLMNLSTQLRPKPENLRYDRPKMDAKEFENLCYKYSFLSIAKQLDKFLTVFKDNKYVNVV